MNEGFVVSMKFMMSTSTLMAILVLNGQMAGQTVRAAAQHAGNSSAAAGDNIKITTSNLPRPVLMPHPPNDGPAALALETAACRKCHIPLNNFPPDIPRDKDASVIYLQWDRTAPSFPKYANPLKLQNSVSYAQLKAVQEIIDKHPTEFKLLRKAAGKPYLTSSPDDTAMFHLMLDGERALTTDAVMLARNGDYSHAIMNEALALNIAKQRNKRSSLYGYIQSYGIEDDALCGFQDILTLAGPNQAVDRRIGIVLQEELPVISLKAGLIGDISNTAVLFNSSRSQYDDFDPYTRHYYYDLYDAAEARYLDHDITLIDAVDLPRSVRRGIFANQEWNWSEADDRQQDPVQDCLAGFAKRDGATLNWMDDVYNAREQVTMAAAAVLEIKAKTGSFPNSLPTTFIDPFTDKPLGYSLDGQGGFTIYSAGMNGTYDGKRISGNDASYTYSPPS